MIKFAEKQLYMKDLSRVYDYFEKKFMFKIDDLTESALKMYINTVKSNFQLKSLAAAPNSKSQSGHRQEPRSLLQMFGNRNEGNKVLFSTYDQTAKDFLSKIFANFGFSSFKCC
jgi:hypothetical protein